MIGDELMWKYTILLAYDLEIVCFGNFLPLTAIWLCYWSPSEYAILFMQTCSLTTYNMYNIYGVTAIAFNRLETSFAIALDCTIYTQAFS